MSFDPELEVFLASLFEEERVRGLLIKGVEVDCESREPRGEPLGDGDKVAMEEFGEPEDVLYSDGVEEGGV